MSRSILFDARLVLDKPTGIGQYITSLVPELLRIAPDWHLHLVRRPDPWSGYGVQEWEFPNLTHHVVSLRRMALRQQVLIPRIARKLGVDLIHYPHFDAPVLLGSIPVVATIHDAKYLLHPEFFTELGMLKRWYMRFSFMQTVHRATAVIAVSKATAQDLQRIFGVDGRRMHVIYEAASSRFEPVDRRQQIAVRKKYGLDRPFVLSVGERRPHKNHADLIRAYARSESQRTHDLVIVGQPYRGYTAPEGTVQELDLKEQVHFLSEVSDNDLVALYSVADLFVLISLYEGFGLPILEAMACGTPVIASSTTATGEITGSGGLQVDPGRPAQVAGAIDGILTNRDLHRQYIQRGFERCQRFSWELTARETLDLYEEEVSRAGVNG